MKLFPREKYNTELIENYSNSLINLKENTELTNSLISDYTDKRFIGQVNDKGFKIISSEIGRGAFCVFIGEFNDKNGVIEIKIHKAFKILLSIILTFPFIGFGLITFQKGFENSLGLIIPMIFALIFIRFIFIGLSFKLISKTGMNKLTKTIGIKSMKKNKVQHLI